jgi:hypothetical protein
MKYAVLLISLLATPAMAEVEVFFPSPSPRPARPSASTIGPPAPIRSWAARGGQFSNPVFGSPQPSATSYASHARYRYCPPYASRFSVLGGPVVVKRALPPLAPLSGRLPCDPYLDDEGCLFQEAGW